MSIMAMGGINQEDGDWYGVGEAEVLNLKEDRIFCPPVVNYPPFSEVGAVHLGSMPTVVDRIRSFIREAGAPSAEVLLGPYVSDDPSTMDVNEKMDVERVVQVVRAEMLDAYTTGILSYEDFERLSIELGELSFLLDMSTATWLEMENDVGTFLDGKRFFEDCYKNKIVLNVFFFSSWMKKCRDFSERKEVYKSALQAGTKLSNIFFNQWFSFSRSYDEIEMVEEFAFNYGFSPEEMEGVRVSRNVFKAVSSDDFLDEKWGEKWGKFLNRRDGKDILRYFYMGVAKEARSDSFMCKAYKAATDIGVRFPVLFFEEWLSKLTDIRKIEKVFRNMAEMNVNPEISTYGVIVSAVGTGKLPQVGRALRRVIDANEGEWGKVLEGCIG